MRSEKLILGRIRCEKALQVVRAWLLEWREQHEINCVNRRMEDLEYFGSFQQRSVPAGTTVNDRILNFVNMGVENL